jgi:hypothetical protein
MYRKTIFDCKVAVFDCSLCFGLFALCLKGLCTPPLRRPIVTNTEALAVSQSFYGHPGTLVDEDKDNAGSAWQVWAKPQAANATAILVLNTASTTRSFAISLTACVGTQVIPNTRAFP